MALPILNVIGDLKTHDVHAYQVLTGKADFAGDRLPVTKLYGCIKHSTIAHGSIKSVDATKALAEPGVKAVITYKDCPAWTQGIFQWGQEVAGVVADDWYTALRALALVDVQYDVQTTVFDPDEAIKAGAALSGVRPDTNMAAVTTVKRGDVAAAMKTADVTLDTTMPWTTTYQHNCLETHQAVAWWFNDEVYIWGPSQNPFSVRSSVVNFLNMPTNKVHFFSHFTGGALGDKTSCPAAAPAACMSRAVGGAPVHLMYSRKENMLYNTRMFSLRSAIKFGAMKDGTIVAADATWWGDGGRNANAPCGGANFNFANTWKIANNNMTVNVINTNSPQRGYYRDVADVNGCACADTSLDKLATQLDMDPYALRMKNIVPLDYPSQDAPIRYWGGGGAGGGVKMCFDKVYSESGYASKWHKAGTKTLPDGRLHGIAITGHIDSHGSVNGSTRSAIITMCDDGTALIDMGGARATSGAPTTMCLITAETLGMKFADVRCGEWGNTDTGLSLGGQNGSGFTGGAGSAFVNAGTQLRNKLFAVAITKAPFKDIAGITVADLAAKDSSVYYTKDPTKTMTYRTVMSGTAPMATASEGWASQWRTKTAGTAKIGDLTNAHGGGAVCAEIAVDTDTGEVEVTGLWNATDTGRTMNKPGAVKEMNSGNEIMVMQAFTYGDIYDAGTGACISSTFTESMLPSYKDMKTENFKVFDIESYDDGGPYGAHGMGEPAASCYSAILCAIFNATGKWVDPEKGACTPNKILKMLGKA
jgi:CO/xanthine dehydrogenase Mo-binding subunit